MKTLVRLFILIFIIFINPNHSFTQESVNKTSDSNEVKNSLKKGMWAIQFGIGSDFTLTNFEGAVLSLKYQLASKTALRLSFNGNYFKRENDTNDYNYSQSNSLGVNMIFMYYLNPKSRFNIFAYAGGAYYYSYEAGQNPSEYQDLSRWTVGPVLGAGAEFFVFKQLSLFAEYSYSFRFGKEEYFSHEYFMGNQQRITDNIIYMSNNTVKFGLPVYF
ncbi:MAG: hypothetical protein M3R36_16665 [Bacteroidota bacterium]|nr:hypothetical protein [Bacteroidota bacterium]